VSTPLSELPGKAGPALQVPPTVLFAKVPRASTSPVLVRAALAVRSGEVRRAGRGPHLDRCRVGNLDTVVPTCTAGTDSMGRDSVVVTALSELVVGLAPVRRGASPSGVGVPSPRACGGWDQLPRVPEPESGSHSPNHARLAGGARRWRTDLRRIAAAATWPETSG
jgi:hypothetical protein